MEKMPGFIHIKRSTFRIGVIFLYAFFLSLIAYAFVPQMLTPKPREKSLRCEAAKLYVGLARAAGENCTTKCTDWAPADCDGYSACYNKNISCTNGTDQDGRPCEGCCFDCTVECEPVDEPPSVSGSISCGQWGKNGWCIDSASLDLNVSDPQGYSLRVTGNAGGTSISCDGDCSIDLPSGSGSANFVVTASKSGMSVSGSASWDYDPESPNLNLNVNGSAGKNGWYRSSVTVTPTGSDSISGLAGTFVSVNGGDWQPSATLDDGEHNIDFTAADRAGNVVNSSTTISVDTTTPSLSVRVRGKSGNGGWYVSDTSVSVSASDSTSGIASVEVSVDGGGYRSYSSPVSFSSGTHTVQFRATDRAGNSTESSGQTIEIDKSGPTVSLNTSELSDGTIAYRAHDGESGMSSIYITIEDLAGVYPKIRWSDSVSGKNVTGEYNWNGTLQDGTSAPPGEYLVWIKAVDQAGHVDTQTGTIVISEGGSLLTSSTLSEDVSASSERTPETEESIVEDTSADASFGGETIVSAEIEKQSSSLSGNASTGSKNPFPWQLVAGITAVAASATAAKVIINPYKKKAKPKKTEEQKAAIKADLYAQAAAKWAAESKAKKAVNEASKKEMLSKKTERFEAVEDVKWQKTVDAREKAKEKGKEKAKKDAEVQAGLAAYYNARKEGEKQAAASAPESNWWEQTKSFINDKVIQPVDTYIVEPIIEPAVEMATEVISAGIKWTDENLYTPYIKPKVDNEITKLTNGFSWLNETIIQPWVIPFAKEVGGVISDGMELLNTYVIEPYVVPFITKTMESAMENVAEFNETVFQPYILPALQEFNEKVYQPYLAPIVDATVDSVTDLTEFVTEHIYEPILAPVVNDINEHIIKPLVDPAVAWLDKTWDEYGELVHNALDAVGFIPGLGDIADAVNGLVYLGEGKYLEAGISLVAMIPVLGDLGKAGKLGLKVGTEIAEEAGEKFAKEVVKEATEIVGEQTAKNVVEKAAKETTENLAEKAAKETTEVGVEKAVKESTEEFAEKAAKETTSEVAERTAQNTLEEASSKTVKASVDNAAEKTVQKTADNILEKTAKETGEAITSAATEKAAKEAKEKLVEQALKKADDKTAKVIRSLERKLGDDVTSLEKGIALLQKHGDVAIKAFNGVNLEAAQKMLKTLDDDVLDFAIKEGSGAFEALSRWPESDLAEHGVELALRATKDAQVLEATRKLVALGQFDPLHITSEQRKLINQIAENSIIYADEAQVVIGKYVSVDTGFLGLAKNTGSLHYSPHPDVWNTLEKLGAKNQDAVAWLVNKQAIQTGISKGLPFECTLSGLPKDIINREKVAISKLFTGGTETELKKILRLGEEDLFPFRFRELQELQQAGYDLTWDASTSTYLLIKP